MTAPFNHPPLCPCANCLRAHVRAQSELLARAAALLREWSDSKTDGETVDWLADYDAMARGKR